MPRNLGKVIVGAVLTASLAANAVLGINYFNNSMNPFLVDLRNVRSFTFSDFFPIVGISVIRPENGIESVTAYYSLLTEGRVMKKDRSTYPSFPCRMISLNDEGLYSVEDEDAITYPYGKENDCSSRNINGAPH